MLDISVMSYDFIHRADKYKRLSKDSVHIALNLYNTLSHKAIKLTTKDFLITKDTFMLFFVDKDIGNLRIFGHFTGKQGPFEDNIEDFKTIVLRAKMQFKDTTLPVNFTWWEGD